MPRLLWGVFLGLCCVSVARAEIRQMTYDGKEIYVHVQKNHVTTILFPETIRRVVRGFEADSYVLTRSERELNQLVLMPTSVETAEMMVTGVSGEDYVLRCVGSNDAYTKLIIRPAVISQEKSLLAGKSDQKKAGRLEQARLSKILPAPLNRKITLKGKDLPLSLYLATIAHVTGYNVITSLDIEAQKASVHLESIEVGRALKSLLYSFGYGFKVSGQDLMIMAVETRIFNIAMPAVEQSFTDETSNQSFASNNNLSSNQQSADVRVGTKIYYENTASKLSLWVDLENTVKALMTPLTGSYAINKASASMVVTDKPSVLDKIAEIVDDINEHLSRQQGFEIQIIEVSLSKDYETGIDWNMIAKGVAGLNNITTGTNFAANGFASGQLLSLSAVGPDRSSASTSSGAAILLKALDTVGKVRVVSKPSIMVSNMFPCIIQEVTSIPYISGTGQTIGNNSTQSNVTTSQVSDGLTMRIAAKIEQMKTVLNISAAVNTLDAMTNVSVGNGLTIQEPQVSTKSITTNVGILPGKTLILGGLISDTKKETVTGIPVLDRMPFFGKAFAYTLKSSQKTELVIMITPQNIIKSTALRF